MLHATAHWWSVSATTKRAVGAKRIDEAWTLVHDPSGDYRPGAKFSARAIDYMQRDGTLDNGAVYERDGQQWVVVGGRLEQVLIGGTE